MSCLFRCICAAEIQETAVIQNAQYPPIWLNTFVVTVGIDNSPERTRQLSSYTTLQSNHLQYYYIKLQERDTVVVRIVAVLLLHICTRHGAD